MSLDIKNGARVVLAACQECGNLKAFNTGPKEIFPPTGEWSRCEPCGDYSYHYQVALGKIVAAWPKPRKKVRHVVGRTVARRRSAPVKK